MPTASREFARKLNAREHGGILERECFDLGIAPGELLDFSSNINPYGPCPAVLEAVRSAPLQHYPDPTAWRVRHALAQRHGCSEREVVFGNGATELLWGLVRAFDRPEAKAFVVEPTFGEFAAAVQAAGIELCRWRASPIDGFALDLDAIGRALAESGARIVYVCSPNSPTGVAVRVGAIAEFAAKHPRVAVVLDLSFIGLSEIHEDANVAVPPNVIRVFSMTKDHALAGLRVGYLIASAETANAVETARPAWSTNALAQAAALAALEQDAFVTESRRRLREDRHYLETGLRRLGLQPVSSSVPFVLVPVLEPAASLRDRLLRRGILVRDCGSFDLPDYIRLCARPASETDRLLAALSEELSLCQRER